ncbi:MAG: histidinol-phosphatase [Sphaerochaeta sp.]
MQSTIHPQATTNLHTHSVYCGHGVGTIAEYESAAQAGGLTLLGFSEHCPFPDDRYHLTRMAYSDHSAYEKDVETVRETSSLEILLGYECDYHRHYHDYLIEVGERVDYLIGGVHFLNTFAEEDMALFRMGNIERSHLVRYTDRYTQMLQSGLFLFGVHPDLFAIGYHRWDEHTISISRAIIECAIDTNMPLEINGYGLQKLVVESAEGKRHAYPSLSFWSLAAEYPTLRVVTSSDAHKPSDVTYGREQTANIARDAGQSLASYGLEGRKVTII